MKMIDREEFQVQFGKFIRAARERRKLNQYEFADLMGVSQPYVSYLERGERDIDLVKAIQFCDALNVDIREFIEEYSK